MLEKRFFFLFFVFLKLVSSSLEAEENKSFLSAGLKFRAGYKLRTGYDPVGFFLKQPYLVSDNSLGIVPSLGFKALNKYFSFKIYFDYYKDMFSNRSVQSFLNKFKLALREIEHREVLFSETFFFSSLFLHPFSFFSYGVLFSYRVKNYSSLIPDYLSDSKGFISDKKSNFLLSPQIIFHLPPGDFLFLINLKEKEEKVEEKLCRNFNFGKNVFLSYSVEYKSKKVMDESIRFFSVFSYDKFIHKKSFYDTKEFRFDFGTALYLKEYLKLRLKYERTWKSHLFDKERVNFFEFSGFVSLGERQKITLRYKFLDSSFEKNEEFSYENHQISLSYSLLFHYKI